MSIYLILQKAAFDGGKDPIGWDCDGAVFSEVIYGLKLRPYVTLGNEMSHTYCFDESSMFQVLEYAQSLWALVGTVLIQHFSFYFSALTVLRAPSPGNVQ